MSEMIGLRELSALFRALGGKLYGFSMRHQAVWAWYRDLVLAVALATITGGLIAGLALARSDTAPVANRPTTTVAPLACRADGVIGQDGGTASAVASRLAGGRGPEALRMMQDEVGNDLAIVQPGQVLSVPVPCG